MRSDVNGCSTTANGQEQYEYIQNFDRVQYDYRTPDGRLFSCIALTLEKARAKRDKWLADNAAR
jgi:hypothetical protein